ncbi:MAG: RnfH family protein [Zetaproteobacteria bacterium]|nr:RnfH family protein [Zetaproteobacteria bacterium]
MLVRVIYARPAEQWQEVLDVPEGSTVAEVLNVSTIHEKFSDLDLSQHKLGVFGKLVKMDEVLFENDRIEIYRALPAKPRNAHAAEDKKARIRAKKERVAEQEG